MDIEQMEKKLKQMLTERRYVHSLGVMETAVELAYRFGEDPEKARLAGLLHDCAKDIDKDKMCGLCDELGVELDDVKRDQKALIHADLGAKLAETEFGVTDPEIKSAILYHTLGRPNMTRLEKILYLSDFIEPNRGDSEDTQMLRELCRQDLDRAMLFGINLAIAGVASKGKVLHSQTLATRDYYQELLKESICREKVTV